uniref:Uncharacterized protein n=1 Tax=Arundo donax TaxID=35708 RepID=A0A0A8Y0I3_ARUDO
MVGYTIAANGII